MYGGNRYEPDAECSDYIRPGRDVDPKYFICNVASEISEEADTLVEVKRGFSRNVQVEVSQAGSTLQWDYRSTGGAIKFGVTIKRKVFEQTKKETIVRKWATSWIQQCSLYLHVKNRTTPPSCLTPTHPHTHMHTT